MKTIVDQVNPGYHYLHVLQEHNVKYVYLKGPVKVIIGTDEN